MRQAGSAPVLSIAAAIRGGEALGDEESCVELKKSAMDQLQREEQRQRAVAGRW